VSPPVQAGAREMAKKNKLPVVESPVEQKPWEAGRPTGVDAKKVRDDPWLLDDEPPRRPATAFNIAAAVDEASREGVRKKDSKGGNASVKNRRETPNPSPIIKFMTKKLNRDRHVSSADMVAALKAVAENGLADGSIITSADDSAFIVMDNGKEKNRLKITSVPATLSALRKKFSNCV
jgi:hypothetical protein